MIAMNSNEEKNGKTGNKIFGGLILPLD